jgi:hypothetical protein
MTLGTLCRPAFVELSSVNIQVTAFAGFRGGMKIRIQPLRFLTEGLVASGTRHCAMSARQGKVCGSVIETNQIFPIRGGMTDFTTPRRPTRPQGCHAEPELSLMRVLMACDAGYVGKVISDRLLFVQGFMAITARRFKVGPG